MPSYAVRLSQDAETTGYALRLSGGYLRARYLRMAFHPTVTATTVGAVAITHRYYHMCSCSDGSVFGVCDESNISIHLANYRY